MSILNEAELEVLKDSRFANNSTGEISATDLRDHMQDMFDSDKPLSGVITDGIVSNIPITATPTKYDNFTTNITSENEIFVPDQANGRIGVKEPIFGFVSIKLNGAWNNGEDLKIQVYSNGLPNPITPIEFEQEGQGGSDPNLFNIVLVPFIITSSMISAGGGQAWVEMFVSSDTGNFNVNQYDVSFQYQYRVYSIRTVG
tara:strand:+ start:922 stop:1521 length:600 start_codon:yes stop_codon:yes gene_type:complete